MVDVATEKPTLKALRINLGWSTEKLAQAANVTRLTVNNAEKGHTVTAHTAKALVDALNQGCNKSYQVTDIQGLKAR